MIRLRSDRYEWNKEGVCQSRGGGVLPPAVRQHDRTEYELFLGVALKWGQDEETCKTRFYSNIILHKAVISTSEKKNQWYTISKYDKADLYELKKYSNCSWQWLIDNFCTKSLWSRKPFFPLSHLFPSPFFT